jgi:hypothetical protein
VLKHKPLYLACLFLHLGIISVLGIRDCVGFIARGYTWLPSSFQVPAEKTENALWIVLGDKLGPAHPATQTLAVYTRAAGIESGYAFFAPNVPDNYRLVFELHYPDGRLEYDLPHVASDSAGIRLTVLLDHLGDTRSDELREVIIRMISSTIWRAHPDATIIRAVFGLARLPSADQFRRGEKESDQFLYAYDFTFVPAPGESP